MENNNVETKKLKKEKNTLKKKALLIVVFTMGALSMYVSVETVALVFLALFVAPAFVRGSEKD